MLILKVNTVFCTGSLFILHKWCRALACRKEHTTINNLFWVYPVLGLKFESYSSVDVAIIQVNQKYFSK
jgi:hypothetical protein